MGSMVKYFDLKLTSIRAKQLIMGYWKLFVSDNLKYNNIRKHQAFRYKYFGV